MRARDKRKRRQARLARSGRKPRQWVRVQVVVDELARFEAALAALDGPAAQVEVARATWRRLVLQEPTTRLPSLGFHEDGWLYLGWNYGAVGGGVHIEPDGRVEWYFHNDLTAPPTRDGSGLDFDDAVPDQFFELARALRAPSREATP